MANKNSGMTTKSKAKSIAADIAMAARRNMGAAPVVKRNNPPKKKR